MFLCLPLLPLLLLFTFSSAYVRPHVFARDALASAPLPPSQDPFYVPPLGYASTKPGTILRNRTLSGVNASLSVQAAYQLLYRTTSATGDAIATVTTILVPPGANFSRHLSYQLYYDQADWDCSPSYALLINATSNATIVTRSELQSWAQNALVKGIVVSTADYEGPSAAFTAGPASAYGTLDGIRAVIASGSLTGMLPTAATIMYGYSGGSIATEWASEFAASYAPELKIIGAALGGLPVNLTLGFLGNSGTSRAGYAAASTVGLAAAYPSFATALNSSLVPSKLNAFYASKTLCENDAKGGSSAGYLAYYAYQDLSTYFTAGLGFLSSPAWLNVSKTAGVMGLYATPKTFPLYIYKGTKDEITPNIEQTDALVKKYCANGAKVQYVRYINGTHGSTLSQGTGAGLTFLFNLIAGGKGLTGCSTTNVSSGLQ